MSRFQVLDHFLLSGVLFDTSVDDVNVVHCIENTSDHDPLFLHLNIATECTANSGRLRVDRIAWYKADSIAIERYKSVLIDKLSDINVPCDALLCRDVLCCNAAHVTDLDRYSRDIYEACLFAANDAIPHVASGNAKRPVPGWTEFVEPAREKSLFWHNIWVDCGRPRTGIVADIMRKTRLAYHYAIRRVKRMENDIISDRFANAMLDNSGRDFWSEVKRMRSNKSCSSNIVDGCTTPDSIAAHFAEKYQDLYTSVAYNADEMSDIISDLNNRISHAGFDASCVIGCSEVASAVDNLKANKNDGNHGLSSNHIKLGPDQLNTHISLLLTGILSHGCVPDDLCVSTVIPIPKGRNANLTDSANYRGISLNSLFGKIFDLIVLSKYRDCLVTSDLQFGFKAKRSTNMCSLVLKECIAYYTNNSSSVYCTMLDATKAFDRVEYCKLFRKLMSRQIPPVIIRMLLNMYINHVTRIGWSGIFSDRFCVKNGVKQGGILSPVLFCIYFDGLLSDLASANIGCFMGGFFVGVLAYADDVVLLAPTPNAMRSMLTVCENYAKEFYVSFNANKSKCLIARPRGNSSKRSVNPTFHVDGNLIETVKEWPHLGHIITSNLSDVADISNRRSSLVGQINNVLCYFGKLDSVTKLKLMKAYCSSYYGCELWDLWSNSVEDFCIAWRRGQRAVLKLPANTHCRLLPLLCDSIPVLDEICRRFLAFILRSLVGDCDLVKFVCRYGLIFGGMNSFCGRNALFCFNRFGFSVDDIANGNSRANDIVGWSKLNRSVDDIQTVSMLLELIFVRDGSFYADGFSKDEVSDFITYLCTL
jgi:hypothetical protein